MDLQKLENLFPPFFLLKKRKKKIERKKYKKKKKRIREEMHGRELMKFILTPGEIIFRNVLDWIAFDIRMK